MPPIWTCRWWSTSAGAPTGTRPIDPGWRLSAVVQPTPRAMEYPEHFDLARGRTRQVYDPVNRDVGKSWDHQLTRPRDSAWAPKARLCRQAIDCRQQPPPDPRRGRRIVTCDVAKDLQKVGMCRISPANSHREP